MHIGKPYFGGKTKIKLIKMKMRIFNTIILLSASLIIMLHLVSCEDFVEKGYRIDYDTANVSLIVEPLGFEMASVNEIISFSVEVNSQYNIKSLIVQSTNNGANGSGYDVSDSSFDDPFADHNYGTIKKNIKSFRVKYNYVVPDKVGKSRITFSVVDEEGKVSIQKNIKVVPAITKYTNRSLYAKDNVNNDAFSTVDGIVYPDIKTNFTAFTDVNIQVQKLIDIIFYYDKVKKQAIISSPKSNSVGLNLNVENNTLFKKLNISVEDFDNISAASLVQLTQNDSIYRSGSSIVENVKVGDIIGFTTDLNGVESLKTGLIKIKSLHPTIVERYSGISYVMDCDIVTQVKTN